MREKKEEYRLQLEGRWTENVDEIVAECAVIRECLEGYGLRVIGYDPGVLVCDAERPNSSSMDIPTWFLKRLLARQSNPPPPTGAQHHE
jgi:hypothetical protein